MLSKWFRSIRRLAPSRPRRASLAVTALEDRCVPAAYVVTGTGDESGFSPATGTGQTMNPYTIQSLRSAIEQANANPGTDIINFGFTGGTISTGSAMQVDSVIIVNGGNNTIEAENGVFRCFDVDTNSAFFQISNLTIRLFTVSGNGAVFNVTNGATLQAQTMTFSENSAISLGGVAYIGPGSVGNFFDDVFSGNSAGVAGGAIAGEGEVRVRRSSFNDNSIAGGLGGAIYGLSDGVIDASLFTNNHVADAGSTLAGGALGFAGSASYTITNSTFTGNSAAGEGGAVAQMSGTTVFVNSTIAFNHAEGTGGGIYAVSGTTTLRNTVVAKNTETTNVPNDIAGVVYANHAFIGTDSHATLQPEGNAPFTIGTQGAELDPLLDSLKANGGPTMTMLPLPGSPLIDAGDNAIAVDSELTPLAFDQRGNGFDRIKNTTVDIGAAEYAAAAASVVWHPLSVPAPAESFTGPGTDQELYVRDLYRTILNREADDGGLASWVAVLQTAGAQAVVNGIFFSPEHRAVQVASYQTILGRTASAGEIDGWVNVLLSGVSEQEVVNAFFLSAEFSAGKDNAAFVEALYDVILERDADAGGLSSWTNALAAGATRLDVINGITYSGEHAAQVVSDYYAFYLGRDADPTGLATWTSLYLSLGQLGEPLIAREILFSAECVALNRE